MENEKTFVMLKPDCIRRRIVGEVIARIEKKGYSITDAKMTVLSDDFINVHYAHIADKPFFPAIKAYMCSGPVLGMVVCGENAIAGVRTLMGATKSEDALAGTIRGDYATSTSFNVIHGSDSAENAAIEIQRFFGY